MRFFGISLSALFAFVPAAVLAIQKPAAPPAARLQELRAPDRIECADRRPGAGGPQKDGSSGSASARPYILTRLETRAASGFDKPALTITSDPNNRIVIVGKQQHDFSMQYCGRGDGSNEAEARERLGTSGMTLNGGVVNRGGGRTREIAEREVQRWLKKLGAA